MAHPVVARPRLTETQLDAYFDRVKIPKLRRHLSVDKLNEDEKMTYFQLLFKHHLVTIPWDNLVMHYSWHHAVSVDPEYLLNKIAGTTGAGRGGYCFETNLLFHVVLYSLGFHVVLYSLGFNVYLAGSRIYSPVTQKYGGWSHMVNLVTLQGRKYVADSGYGGNGIIKAIALEHGVEHIHVGSSRMRLMYEPISQNLDQSQKLWIYQHQVSTEREWQTLFCFTELEFLLEDVERLNLSVYSWRHTFFAHKVVATRFTTAGETLVGEEGPGSPSEESLEAEIDGCITLAHDHLYWRRNGVKVTEIQITTEKERLHALRKYFGVDLKADEAQAIAGTAAELTDARFSL